jgi:hypothetical protein
MEHTKHIWRASILLILIAVGAVVGRHFLVPESFGEQGFYRNDSLAEYKALPVRHGDADSCLSCHKTECDAIKGGKHATVSCQGCHNILSAHAKDNAKIADAPVDKTPSACLLCHGRLRARPETFPQIDAMEHLIKNGVISKGEAIPDEACITCHDVHNPGNK